MKQFFTISFWGFLFFTFVFQSAFAQGNLIVHILPEFRGQALVLQNNIYKTIQGDSISIDEFKCYISNLTLQNTKTTFVETSSYHLLDAEDTSSLSIMIKSIPKGNYTSVSFAIGVDSVANLSGAMDGALDPSLGMYWAWNTGYINAKLMGHSSSCATLHHAFEFHIGGYMSPYATLRNVTLALNALSIQDHETSTITLHADLATWFETIQLANVNHIVLPSKDAVNMANSYAKMFTVSK